MKSLFTLLVLSSTALADGGWRFSAGYAPMVGLKSEFSGFGNFTNPFPVPAPAPTGSFIYQNGSVQTDVSGNAGNATTFFSYTSAAQIAGGSLSFTTLSGNLPQAGNAAENAIAAAAGFEFSGYLELGAVKLPFLRDQNTTWGIKLGYQFANTDIHNSDTLSSSLGTITDGYTLAGGGPFPPAPYNGPFNGFGPLLNTAGVTRTVDANGTTATLAGSRNLLVNLHILQFGSYLDIPVAEKLDLMLEGGFLLGIASGEYDFSTTVSVPGYAPQTSSGKGSRNRVLPGFYVGLGLRCPITQRLSLQASARYQYMRPFDITTNGSTASLNFDSAFVLSLAAVWKF
ncbi:MAG: hypothetical protein IPK22_27940 [Verrucomicrobiaceae bacterium]|nr:hypothetical protein [Verrucomicrobiaceae bacterium]